MDRVNHDRNRSANPLTAENALAAYDIVSRNALFASPSKLPNPLPACSNPRAIGAENLLAFYEIPSNRLFHSSPNLLNPLAAGSAPARAPSPGSQQADPPATKYPDNVLAYAASQKSDRAPTQVDPLEDRRDLGATLQPSTRTPSPAARTQPPQQFSKEPATYAEVFARYLQDKAQLWGAVAPVLQPTRPHAEALIDLIEEGISLRVEVENCTAVFKIDEKVLRKFQRHKPTAMSDNEQGVPSGSELIRSKPSCADKPHAVSPIEETSFAAKPPRSRDSSVDGQEAGGRPVDIAPRTSAADDKPVPVPELEAELDAASAAADEQDDPVSEQVTTEAATVDDVAARQAEARRREWDPLVNKQRGNQKQRVIAALMVWAKPQYTPGVNPNPRALLERHRAKYGKLPRITEVTMRPIRAKLAPDEAKRIPHARRKK